MLITLQMTLYFYTIKFHFIYCKIFRFISKLYRKFHSTDFISFLSFSLLLIPLLHDEFKYKSSTS